MAAATPFHPSARLPSHAGVPVTGSTVVVFVRCRRKYVGLAYQQPTTFVHIHDQQPHERLGHHTATQRTLSNWEDGELWRQVEMWTVKESLILSTVAAKCCNASVLANIVAIHLLNIRCKLHIYEATKATAKAATNPSKSEIH